MTSNQSCYQIYTSYEREKDSELKQNQVWQQCTQIAEPNEMHSPLLIPQILN